MKFQAGVIEVNSELLFELYSTGMALGQVDVKNEKNYPKKARIEQNLKNADIEPFLRNGERYLNESMLYDFMLEAKTEKCKFFW